MKYISWFTLYLSLLVFLLGCAQNPNETQQVDFNSKLTQEPLLKANKQLVLTEDQQIRNLIERYGWNVKETGTGLRYLVYFTGKGQKAEKGKIVKINYEVKLITGDIIYSSAESGPKEFKIGSGGVESGLEEGILLLHVGDKAKLIMPSHLAWGLIGDQDRIPPKSTLIYDINVLGLR